MMQKAIPRLSKEAWIGLLSSLIEAYNMAIYTFIAPSLAFNLFQKSGNALLFSYCLIFIASCLLYPIGSIYYGFLGDKEGRQKTCVHATLGLSIATGLMGCIPTNLLGDKVWLLYLILICMQHFFSGGEYHGSIIFSLEHATKKKSGFMSGASCLFAVFGLCGANLLATCALNSEIWIRSCFWLGGIGGIVSYFLKNHCQETPAFIALSKERKIDLSSFIKAEWRKLVSVILVLAFFIISYSFIFVFLPLTYEIRSLNFDTFKSLLVYGLLLLITGSLADYLGLRKTLLLGSVLFGIIVIPLSSFCSHLLTLQILLTLCASFVIGPIHGWMIHQFRPEDRCRGIFISSAVATSLFGGSTVPICLMLFKTFDSLAMCAIYPFSIALFASLSLIFNHNPEKNYDFFRKAMGAKPPSLSRNTSPSL